MKKAPIVLIIILAILAGAFFAGWNFYANYTKDLMVKNITAALEETKLGSVEYEDVSVSGFPLNVTVTFKNAKTQLNSGELFKALFRHDFKKGRASKQQMEKINNLQWTDNLRREGDVIVSTNLMSDKFSIKTSGDYYYDSTINGKEIKTVFKGDPSQIEIDFSKSPVFIDYENKDLTTKKYFEKLFTHLTRFEYSIGKNSGHNVETDELLYKSDGTLLLYNIEHSGEGQGKVEIKIKDTNTKIEKGLEDIYNVVLGALFAEPDLTMMQGMPNYDLSRNGPMSTDIHLTYQGGVLIKNKKLNKDASFVINFPKLNFKNDLADVQLTGGVRLVNQNKKPVEFEIKYDGKFLYDEKWYNYFFEDIDEYKKMAIDSVNDGSIYHSNPMLAILLQDLKRESGSNMTDDEFMIELVNKFFDHSKLIIPKAHKWGKIENVLDLKFENKGTEKIELREFRYVTNPEEGKQGVSIVGSGIKDKQRPMFNFNVTIFNYSNLVDDLYAYTMNAIEFGKRVFNKEMPYKIQDGIEKAVKQALFRLSGSQDKNSKDITINAVMDDKNPMPMIGNMPIFQAMGILQELSLYVEPVADNSSMGYPDGQPGGRGNPGGNIQRGVPVAPSGSMLQVPAR